jgi:hypothetical protein
VWQEAGFPAGSLVTAHAAHSRPVSDAPPGRRQSLTVPGGRARRRTCAPHSARHEPSDGGKLPAGGLSPASTLTPAAPHRSSNTHQGISVWEPTGRPGSATASTAMRGRVTGLSRNLQRSPDCAGGSECVPTRPVGNDAGAFATYGRASAAHPARRCAAAQSRWQQGRGAQTRGSRQPTTQPRRDPVARLSEHWCRRAAYCPGLASTRATRREQDHGRCMPGALADHGRSTAVPPGYALGRHGHDLAAGCVSAACCQAGSTQPSISIRYEPAPAVIRCCRMSGTTPAAVAKSESSCRMVR